MTSQHDHSNPWSQYDLPCCRVWSLWCCTVGS